jgi:dihydroorotate dehydrogenase/Pyruvate/2-oxoacid:ferredoxin oxidoreductase delta subunit
MSVDLSVKITDRLSFKNPFISAAGPIAGTAENIKKLADAGFGAIITKTASNFGEFQRYPRPLYYVVDYRRHSEDPYYADSWDWMHLDHNSQYPPQKFVEIVRRAFSYCRERNCTLIPSYAGGSVEEWVSLAKAYVEAGADALELNFCCPYPKDMVQIARRKEEAMIGQTFAEDPDAASEVIRQVKKAIPAVPIFPKMPPTARRNIVNLAKLYEQTGSEGITLYANNKVLRIDIETGKPYGYGCTIGTSPGFKMEVLYDTTAVAKATGLKIMGGRGGRTWRDAVEFLMAGASGLQYSVAIMFHGLGYVGEMVRGFEKYMERRGFGSISEFQGIALKHMLEPTELKQKVKPLFGHVKGAKCIGCGRCQDVCSYDAIRLHLKGLHGASQIIRERCVGCTLCGQVCPQNAIEYQEREDAEYVRALFSGHPELAPDDVVL